MKIVFMGTPDFAESIVDSLYNAGHEITLCVTQPDKARGRSSRLIYSEVKRWALAHNIDVFQPEKIKTSDAVSKLKQIEADIFVVAAFGQILSQEILDIPKYGCVNVHASLLPKYRGAAPIQWSIINGDEVTGITTMKMGPGLDDGDIIDVLEVPIALDETAESLFDKMAEAGAKLIVETLANIENGTASYTKQDESSATHVGMIKKSMGEVDFTQSVYEIERLIRGLYPWPGTYTYLDGKTMKILEAHVYESDLEIDDSVDFGEVSISNRKAKTLAIRCKDGLLSIDRIQLEGKKPMLISDFLNGRKIEVGDKLGRQ